MAIDLRHLRQVRVVAEMRSFSRAARALHVSQPTLTRSIQSLEAELGVRLFDRGRRGVEPTAIGRLVLQHARRAEAVAGDLRRELELARGAEIGRLHVGVGPWGGTAFIGPAVAGLVQQRTQLRVQLTVVPRHEFIERLRHRELDMVVGDVTGLDEHPDVDVTRFGEHRTLVVCRNGHPLTRRPRLELADLFGYALAGPPLEPHVVAMLREHPSAEFRALWTRPEGAMPLSCDVPVILKSILQRTDALSLMPAFMIADEVQRHELAILRGFDIGLGVPYGTAWLRDRTLSPPAAALVEALLAHDRELQVDAQRLAAGGRRKPGRMSLD